MTMPARQNEQWVVNFTVIRPLKNFPQPRTISSWQAASPDFRHPGRYRREPPHCMFMYTLAGYGHLRAGSQIHRLEPGTAFLCDSEDPQISYYYPSAASRPWRFLYFSFKGARPMVEGMVEKLGYIYKISPTDPLIQRLQRFRTQSSSNNDLSAAEGAELVISLLSDLCRVNSARLDSSSQGKLVRAAFKAVEENISKPFSVAMLANKLKVTPQHLSRVFKSELGNSPIDFINESKINRACDLLRNTNLPINKIAEKTGMDNASHFARTFKRLKNISPRTFRQKGL